MARRGGLLVAAAALTALSWSAALADDVSFDRPGWAETGWVRVWPTGKAANGALLEGFSHPIFLVLVVPERVSEKEVYLDAGRTLCPTDEVCGVIYLTKIGEPLTLDVFTLIERYYLGTYIKTMAGETFEVPCEKARIDGCDP